MNHRMNHLLNDVMKAQNVVSTLKTSFTVPNMPLAGVFIA